MYHALEGLNEMDVDKMTPWDEFYFLETSNISLQEPGFFGSDITTLRYLCIGFILKLRSLPLELAPTEEWEDEWIEEDSCSVNMESEHNRVNHARVDAMFAGSTREDYKEML